MRIFFFTRDETGIIYAGFSVNGKRHLCYVWNNGGTHYVVTGSKHDGNLKQHVFSEGQEAVFADFQKSDLQNEEYWRGII